MSSRTDIRDLNYTPAQPTALRRISEYLSGYEGPSFEFALWDGRVWRSHPSVAPAFTITLNSEAGLLALASGDELRMAEAYVNGFYDIAGDMVQALALGEFLQAQRATLARRLGRMLIRMRPAAHSLESDRNAIRHHYDVSNDFYRQWLDSRMVYSCAYFSGGNEDLESAQLNKLDYICRKLRLKPGDRFLDVGCGWGGLIMHASRKYGAHAIGITLSKAQAELAGRRVTENGLAEICEVLNCDYRELEDNTFDKIASVGMFEHVGAEQLALYFKILWGRLKPGGMLLNHGIADVEAPDGHERPKSTFIRKYVFPDGELVPIWKTLEIAGRCGFEVCDVESLRQHYYLTLKQWVNRLQEHHERIKKFCGEEIYRIWRLYMAGSAHSFDAGRLNLYQTLLRKPGGVALPLTRADWYE